MKSASMMKVKSFFRTPCFKFNEYLHRKPDPDYEKQFVTGDQIEEARSHVSTLKQDGIAILPGYIKGEQLEKLQGIFDSTLESNVDEDQPVNPESQLNGDFIFNDPAYLDLSTDDFLMQIVSNYFHKQYGIARSSAMRLDPVDDTRYGSYQWHHDTRGRQVHIMILLNDIPEDGQRMSYLAGTHNTYYSYYRGVAAGSRFEADVKDGKIDYTRKVELAGPAGTVGIFDSNGLHCGNRNSKNRRDCLLFCYASWRHFLPLTYDESAVADLPAHRRDLVTYNPRHKFVSQDKI